MMKLRLLGLASLLAMACIGPARAAEKTGFLYHQLHQDPDGTQAAYVLFVPHNYKAERPTPLILFLHGAGETGTDGEKQVKVGLGTAIQKQEKTFPCITIFPQSQKRTWRADSPDADRALAILEGVRKAYNVDPKRIYLTGLSMGGYGTWSLAEKYPERWAAIVPICGGGNPKEAAKIKDLPCWCFHGATDGIVAVGKSRDMIKALEAAGGHPNYTEYPGVGHLCWNKAYGTPELFDWLFQQHLP